MTENDEWDPSQIRPEDIKVITRKPRWRKEGSLSKVHHRKVGGDLKDLGGPRSSVNTQHRGPNEKRPIEQIIENNEG